MPFPRVAPLFADNRTNKSNVRAEKRIGSDRKRSKRIESGLGLCVRSRSAARDNRLSRRGASPLVRSLPNRPEPLVPPPERFRPGHESASADGGGGEIVFEKVTGIDLLGTVP